MFNNKYFQESTAFENGQNFIPINNMYTIPKITDNDSLIYILSDSYENDLNMIKKMVTQNNYDKIIIPSKLIMKMGLSTFTFNMNHHDYNKHVIKLNALNLKPKLTAIPYPYPKNNIGNVYIPLSEVLISMNSSFRSLGKNYIKANINKLFSTFFDIFSKSAVKTLMINVNKFRLYKDYMTDDVYCSDIINAFIKYLLDDNTNYSKLNLSIIFRHNDYDIKLDLNKYDKESNIEKLKKMMVKVGNNFIMSENESDTDDTITDSDATDSDNVNTSEKISDENTEDVSGMDSSYSDDEKVRELQHSNSNISTDIKSSIASLKSKYVNSTNNANNKEKMTTMYDAKTLSINTSLLKKINPDANNVIGNYEKISADLNNNDNNSETTKIIDDASKKLATMSTTTNENDIANTTTSARELALRNHFGQIKLNDVSLTTLTSISDAPLPKPLTPLHMTTTNLASLKGTAFPNVTKEYETKLMDRDIVATFMNLSKLPNGYIVDDIKVTDISNITTLMNSWSVTMHSNSDSTVGKLKLNVYIPIMNNGRFLYNGNWYNIEKQDFPIPILKVNKKRVMITSNYNKIDVTRYDTRSLIDITMLVKLINKMEPVNGKNKYVIPGSSVTTNSRYVSTIEYDEFAKIWYSFINEESGCEIYFNRNDCVSRYSFVTVNDNEFCCGMLNKVPIVVNTDTAKTRQGLTLTDLILQTLPDDLQRQYSSFKPGKMSMCANIKIGQVIPLGVACAAWEGLSSLLKKSECKYRYVDKTFTDQGYIKFVFKDKILAIENTITNQLIFNGFYRINTKAYSIGDFDIPIMQSNSVFVDIFNQLFFKHFSQLTTFIGNYNFFVDVITKDVCLHYNVPDDLVGMLLYATNILSDNNFSSETNSALYRIRSSEIIPAILHYTLAVALSKHNNIVGSKTHGNKLVYNPNTLVNELVRVNTVKPISALNPIVELHERENISKEGFKGVNTSVVPVNRRTYDNTYIGRMAMSSPNNGSVGITRQLTADPKITSLRGYTDTSENDNYTDLQLSSFSELLTPGTVTRDDAIRTAIATSQSSHIVATDAAEPVIVSNGVDELVPAYLSNEFSVVAEEDGIIIDDNENYIIIEYKSGKKNAINISDRYSFNTGSGFFVDNKLKSNFEVGDSFKKGDILAYHEKFFTKDSSGQIRMNIGPLAKVAFAGLYSTYEDSGLMTSKMSKKLSTNISMLQAIKLNATDDIEKIVSVGDNVEIGDPLVTFGLGGSGDKAVDNFLRAFQSGTNATSIADSSKHTIRSKNAGKVVDVRIYTSTSMDKLSPSLFDIISNYFKENKKRRKILDKYDKSSNVFKLGTFYDLPVEPLKGSTIKGIHTDVLVEIKIMHSDDASTGDKCVVYGASKQIISEVVPEGQEPYTENRPNEEVSMFVAPSSILKRMIPSLMITASANKVAIVLKEKIGKIWKDNK